MPRHKGTKFYAVQDGRETGVFLTWEECEKQVKGYPGAKFKSFGNAADAEAYVSAAASTSHIAHTNPFSSNTKGKKRAMPDDVEDESGWDVVYCDGACKGNGRAGSVAGVGVWWEDNDPRNIAERCPGDQTNNRAELIAIVRMLEETPRSQKPLLIKTDSQYCIKCFREWLPKWAANNYKTSSGGEVKNLGVIKYLSALLGVRAMFGQKVVLQHVKGHSGDRGNDGADYQANLGACLPPLAERDWIYLEEKVRKQADADRRGNLDKVTPETLKILGDDTLPHKVRKVSHEIPFSTSTSSAPAPSPLVRLTRIFSSPPSEKSPTTQSTAVRPTLPSRKPFSASRSQRFDSPSRQHGAGFFVTSPPSTPGKRGLKDLPSASERAKALGLVPNGNSIPEAVRTGKPPLPAPPVAMSVNKEDVNLNDYLDCLADDEDLSF